MFLISLPSFPWWLLLFGIIAVIVWCMALVSAATSEFTDSNTKLIWVLIILFASFFGAILYFAAGTKQAVQLKGISVKYAIWVGAAILAIPLTIAGIAALTSWSEHAEIERRSQAEIAASHAYFDSVRKAQQAAAPASQ
jgi:hypothetical protein